MSFTNIVFLVIIVLNMLLSVFVVFLERRNASTTWAWLMVLAFLPVLGFMLYMVLGQNLRRRKVFKWDRKVHTYIQEESDRQLQHLTNDQANWLVDNAQRYSKLIRMNLNNNNSVYTGDNHVQIFTDGKEKFEMLMQDMKSATNHIHILYYIIRSDELGNKIADILVEKVREGVSVRVLYDASGSRKLSKKFIRRIKDAGGEIIAFFPTRFPLITFHLNYRNHRKIVVIDGEVGYIGGFNIGDEYIGKHPKFGYWRDTHMKIRGQSVNNLQARFILDWNQATKQNISLLDFTCKQPSLEGNVGIQIVASGPDSRWEHIKNGFIEMIQSAKQFVYIQTPYFIPDDSMLDAIKIAASSGVDVRIMVPGIADHPFVFWASQSYFGELLTAGVRFYRYQNGFLHAKVMVADNRISTVGTANMDVRSFRLNFEVNAFVYDSDVAYQLAQSFYKDMEQSIEFTMEYYNNRPFIVRIKESISRLLSPIL